MSSAAVRHDNCYALAGMYLDKHGLLSNLAVLQRRLEVP